MVLKRSNFSDAWEHHVGSVSSLAGPKPQPCSGASHMKQGGAMVRSCAGEVARVPWLVRAQGCSISWGCALGGALRKRCSSALCGAAVGCIVATRLSSSGRSAACLVSKCLHAARSLNLVHERTQPVCLCGFAASAAQTLAFCALFAKYISRLPCSSMMPALRSHTMSSKVVRTMSTVESRV